MYEIINNVPLQVKEYKGQHVVTFKDIDRVHNRPEGTAGRNFRKNREYFIEGKDYFTVCADEIRRNKIMDISPKTHADVILVTEYGYMMIVKSLTDDLSWVVQRQLVNTYFRAKEINNSHDERIYEKLEVLERKIDELEKSSGKRMNSIINAVDKTASDAVKTLNPCFYALDSKIESVAKTIIRSVSGNVKLLAVYIDYLIKRKD